MFGSQTLEVDGQRQTFPSSYAFSPARYGPQTTGVPQVSPTAPPFVGAAAGPGMSGGGNSVATGGAAMTGVDGYGTADNNGLVTQIASENPHNLRVSPVWWTVGMFALGIFMLRSVHWRSIPGGS